MKPSPTYSPQPRGGRPRRGYPWLLATLVLAMAAVGLYFLTGTSGQPSRAAAADRGDVSAGPLDAAVVLVEYSDFQCEFCAAYSAMLAPIRAHYQDRVRFVFRFFPLPNHEHAMIAAQAAYAAYQQDGFWEMHDLLFERQEEWAESGDALRLFESYAGELGLDIDRFREDADAPSTREFIQAQVSEGDAAGVDHTPWFVIDGTTVQPQTPQDFERLLQERL